MDEFVLVNQAEALYEVVTPLPRSVDGNSRQGIRRQKLVRQFVFFATWCWLISASLFRRTGFKPFACNGQSGRGSVHQDEVFLVFAVLLESVTKTHILTWPRPPELEVTELDDHDNFLKRQDSQPAVTSLYTNRSVLFFSIRWMAPRAGLHGLRSGSKRTMSL